MDVVYSFVTVRWSAAEGPAECCSFRKL